MPNLFKTFQECQHYEDTNLSLNEERPQMSSNVKEIFLVILIIEMNI